jgi:hypothetical protein
MYVDDLDVNSVSLSGFRREQKGEPTWKIARLIQKPNVSDEPLPLGLIAGVVAGVLFIVIIVVVVVVVSKRQPVNKEKQQGETADVRTPLVLFFHGVKSTTLSKKIDKRIEWKM